MLHLDPLHTVFLNYKLRQNLLGALLPQFSQLAFRSINLQLKLRFVRLDTFYPFILPHQTCVDLFLKRSHLPSDTLLALGKRFAKLQVIFISFLRDVEELLLLFFQ